MKKEILLISNLKSDFANKIMQWVPECKISRINQEDKIEKFFLDLSQFLRMEYTTKSEEKASIEFTESDFDDFTILIYQGFLLFPSEFKGKYFENESLNISISVMKILLGFPNTIGALPEEYNFKLYNLFLAKKLGLKTPETQVLNSIPTSLHWSSLSGKITKPVTNVFYGYWSDKLCIGPGTVELDTNVKKGNIFSSSLIQNKVEKRFEIRSVYFRGDFYSMAIFSQRNEKTCIDFRNYDEDNPNRYIPFKLPSKVERKLEKMANILHLKFCSFDLIFDNNDEYVFLEVNPEGQVGWLSSICNYNIEFHIASYLIKNNERA